MDPATGLHIRTRPAGDYTIVAIGGELDIATAYALRERLLDVLRRHSSQLVVDLSGVSFCDASGLATLVATGRRAHLLGGTLRLAAPRPQIRKMLRLTGLNRHFATYPTTAAACRSHGPPTPSATIAESATPLGRLPDAGAQPALR